MREVAFLKKNAAKWQAFEETLKNPKRHSADSIADLYIELTNDLSFAQSNYPTSKTTRYLNELTVRAHDTLYKSKKVSSGRFKEFWGTELPLLYSKHQKPLLISFLVFVLAITIGAFSSANDARFIRSILGDYYVNMTIENIQNGDPLAVYKSESQLNMFLGITINNIRVSFLAFAAGLVTALGPAYILFRNGIMVGSFFHLFYTYGIFNKAFLVVFIHGALELSVIVIAGAAGMVIGNSFLFPGTYTRLESFKKAGKQSVKMVVGLVPIFVMAGFLESFVTRYTEMPILLSLCIIFGSFTFIIYYFVVYPQRLKRTTNTEIYE
ncbi:stage II sporulation protein M [Balneola vulgaris]|uniref:stage II sporulation protein M n=1 Tax=Balneola vulgaris TaxID=287535 RepID=UPI00037555D9|nr:stage II sporulation protein M [Balneola vulgaris]